MKFGKIILPRFPFFRKPLLGVIYDSSWNKNAGEFIIEFPASTITLDIQYNPPVKIIRALGYSLITISIIELCLVLQPLVSSELKYRLSNINNTSAKVQARIEAQEREIALIAQRKLLEKEIKEKEYAKTLATQFGVTNTKYSIYIPRIDAKSTIIENVNPADEIAYNEALMQGVAHAEGSSVPGKDGGIYLFAHSTNAPWNISKYNAIFYLLRELDPINQDIIYIFHNDKVYKYKVTQKHTVEATDISWITNAPKGPQRLILQTCWPPGTTWKRIILIAEPDIIIPEPSTAQETVTPNL